MRTGQACILDLEAVGRSLLVASLALETIWQVGDDLEMDGSAHLSWRWDLDEESSARAPREPNATLAPNALPPERPFDAPTLSRYGREKVEFSIHWDGNTHDHGVSDPAACSRVGERPTQFPQLNAVIGGFRLLKILGRGSFAHVYLAEQEDLADRLVALKVSKAEGDEPKLLAQLQHTNIVPIHSVATDRDTGLRLLCMPYFGGANLAEILRTAGSNTPSLATGRSLIDALDRVGGQSLLGSPSLRARSRARSRNRSRSRPRARSRVQSQSGPEIEAPRLGQAAAQGVGSPSLARSRWGRYLARFSWADAFQDDGDEELTDVTEEPARKFLRSHSYVQAAVWIAARLAEGLEHAHERGILHRDLKPSNILVAADGTPMLLDFNLSADNDHSREAVEDDDVNALGGTLPYMAPEHLDAFNPHGSTSPDAVDERSDVYALGLILFEMVAGRHPFSDPPEGLKLTAVLQRMRDERLKGAPSARASNPAAPWSLDSILNRCLEPEPFERYQSAADVAEDLNRFLDDRPLKHAPEPSVRERVVKWSRRHPRAASAGSIGTAAMVAVALLGVSAWGLREAWLNASARVRLREFRDEFAQCQLLLNTSSGPVDHLGPGLALASRALQEYEIERTDVNWLTRPAARRLSNDERTRLREEISELLMLQSRAEITLAERKRSEGDQREALKAAVKRLTLAERIDPHPPVALFADRARDLAALGEAKLASLDRSRADELKPTSARDLYLLGTSLLVSREYDRAEDMLNRAVAADAKRFWAWFVLGLCHHDQKRYLDAAGDFSACTALAPEFAWPYLNRGLALAAAGRLRAARDSYDQALKVSPKFMEAHVNRALVRLELDDAAGALADIDFAIQNGRAGDPGIRLARAEALGKLNRRDDALKEFSETLKTRPDDPAALVARGFFRMDFEPSAAAADLNRVVARDSGQGRARHQARARYGLALLTRSHDLAAALKLTDVALEQDPSLLDALQLRALLRARLGQLSAVSDVDRLLQAPTARRFFNAACALSLLAKATGDDRYLSRALEHLRSAAESGFDRALMAKDPDMDPLRGVPEFDRIVGGSRS
jgi:eukaryotic-like serine/threonine-protein kinase